jgi:WD40 repeat protein
VVVGGFDGRVALWDVAGGGRQLVREYVGGHGGHPVHAVATSPDGSRLASSGSDGTIVIWDGASGERIGPPLDRYGDADVNVLAFSPDGRWLAAGTLNGYVLLWDVASGRRIGPPLAAGGRGSVQELAFSPDGALLASAGSAGAVVLWDVNPASWQSRAGRIANRNLTRREWRYYLGDEPYRVTFPGLPVPRE